MRLDHLLSKENRVFLFCRLGGCWLAPGWWQVFVIVWCLVWARSGGKVFQVGNCRTHFMCVVLGVDETRTFCGLSALVGCKGFCRVTSVFVFGFVLFCGMLLGV